MIFGKNYMSVPSNYVPKIPKKCHIIQFQKLSGKLYIELGVFESKREGHRGARTIFRAESVESLSSTHDFLLYDPWD